MTQRQFLNRVLITLGAIVSVVLLWHLREVLVLFFGGVVVAVTLTAMAVPLRLWTGWSRRTALTVVLLLLLVLLSSGLWLLGAPLAAQFERLRDELPRALEAAGGWIDTNALGAAAREAWRNMMSDGVPWARVASLATVTVSSVATFGLVVVVGIYLAAAPDTYRRGFVRLLPRDHREVADDALATAGDRLFRWLVGQGLSMLVVGVMTTLALTLIGMPLALALGIIAALLDFIPFFGPIVAGVLAVLLAFVEGPQVALQVAIAMLAIQQIEGNVLMPLVQRWAVSLPPVLALLAVVIFGLLFGLPGVVLATPLMVVVMGLIDKLYVEQVLEAPPSGEVPAQPAGKARTA